MSKTGASGSTTGRRPMPRAVAGVRQRWRGTDEQEHHARQHGDGLPPRHRQHAGTGGVAQIVEEPACPADRAGRGDRHRTLLWLQRVDRAGRPVNPACLSCGRVGYLHDRAGAGRDVGRRPEGRCVQLLRDPLLVEARRLRERLELLVQLHSGVDGGAERGRLVRQLLVSRDSAMGVGRGVSRRDCGDEPAGGEQVRRVRILVRDHQDRRGDSDDRRRARGTDCRTANGFRRQGELLELVRARWRRTPPTACCSKVPTANGPDC